VPECAFFLSDGERFLSTELTRGPWSPHHQHAGPPAALLGRAIEQAPASAPMQVARVTFDIVRPIPIEPLEVSVRQVRAGRSVELLEGTLTDDGGELMRASAWRIRTGDVDLELRHDGSPTGLDAPLPPEQSASRPFFDFGWDAGYHTAMDARVAKGSFGEPGPASVWLRMRQPLVDSEEPSPLTRVLVAADSGNGVSWTLDLRRFLFVNVDLSVHLHRLPRGEWVCLDAATTPEPDGLGLADTTLWDEAGPIGRSLQTLLIDRRSAERA
jgi:Acyl-CoA thioesterase C-terminal domain/Acyl-CoA thioesterase N-terminal domain